MTVSVASPRRAVIDLGADATILDAAHRLASTEAPEIVLVVAAGAPLARNAAFLEVLRRRAGDRRIVLVSSDAKARSLAAAVHLRTFSSVAALERHELDATEHLTGARRAALTRVAATGGRRGMSPGRAIAVAMSLLAAVAILVAVVAPSATIVLSATATTLGPYEYDLRAGPGGDIRAETLQDRNVVAKTTGRATGVEQVKSTAVGQERFTNLTTSDIRIQSGTIVQTPDGIRFETTEEKVLPRSEIIPLRIGTVMINIKAAEEGSRGNVAAGRISEDSSRDYMVTNPSPTTGGTEINIPVVQQADYDLAVAQADADLAAEAKKRVQKWEDERVPNTTVYGQDIERGTISPASEVVGRKGKETFEISVTITVTAYRVPASEPRAAALDKLRLELAPRMDFDRNRAEVQPIIGPSVGKDGVHWRVRARAQQYTSPTTAGQMKAALAGRGLEDTRGIVEPLGFQVKAITTWPSWWPRLPVLDSRITIDVEPTTASSPP